MKYGNKLTTQKCLNKKNYKTFQSVLLLHQASTKHSVSSGLFQEHEPSEKSTESIQKDCNNKKPHQAASLHKVFLFLLKTIGAQRDLRVVCRQVNHTVGLSSQ